MKSYKYVDDDGTPEDLISMAVSEFEGLADELSEWRDGMSGTNLESSDKYMMLDEAVSTLEGLQDPDIDEWPHHAARVHYSYMTPKRKNRSPSRQIRFENAKAKVNAVVEFYESLDDEEEVQDIIDQLQDLAYADIEIPGMYG